MLRPLIFSFALAALALGQASPTLASDDTSKVNGSIRIDDGKSVGDLSTVNGSIRLGDHGQAEEISTVNGSIDVGDDATIRSAGTVNGRISLGKRARVSHDVGTVNGSLTLEEGTEVSGDVNNVNGTIRLIAAHVGGGIETVSGDIDIGADSTIDGGIHVEKSNSWFNWGKEKAVRVEIGPRAVVKGALIFERDVELFVSDSARIGEVKGAKPVRFSGDHP
ncbi:MAG TPA: hypothetical protein VFN25_00275 [Dokdonella sp.]|uniref:hypothetical protein n=1 Tax=Dokdonella sp. TaxID=2291710 RepID=UPI002D80D86B|nr:hypothetical protein [Dokdonella sp.]HET9031317.1 hypothetical protein [Dokdonella sp.]